MFRRRHGYGSVGFNFFCSALVMLEAVLVIGAVQQGLGLGARVITLDMPLVIDATFCAGSAMIAFGAVLVSCITLQCCTQQNVRNPYQEAMRGSLGGSTTIYLSCGPLYSTVNDIDAVA
jgi:hypothetical protein